MTKDISPYKYIKGNELLPEPYDADENYEDINILEKFNTKEYQHIEAAVLLCVYIFQFINRRSIERFIDTKLARQQRHPSYANNIKKLYRDGAITKYTYGNTHLYSPTEATYSYFREKKNAMQTHVPITNILRPTESISVSKILERASLAQWHISMLSTPGIKVQRNIFSSYATIDGKRVFLPSYIEYSDKKKVLKRFIALPMAKSKGGFNDFVQHIEEITPLFNKSSWQSTATIVVIVCASLDEVRVIGEILRRTKNLDAVPYLYALDVNTNTFDGPKNLYQYECINGNGKIDAFSIQ